jgi:hypothetical protein
MSRTSGQKVERMGQQLKDRLKRSPCTGGASGKVHDQRRAEGSADGPAQRGKGRVLQALGAHAFRQPLDDPIADHARRLWSYIARGKSCTTRGNDQTSPGGIAPQGDRDQVYLIGQCLACYCTYACCLKQARDCGTRQIVLLSTKTTIADCQDDDTGIGLKSHLVSLRPSIPPLYQLSES